MIPELWELGTCGIIEEANGIRAFFEDDVVAETAQAKYSGLSEGLRTEPATPTMDFSQEEWEPICVGRRFFIAPSWVDEPTPPNRLRLTVDSVTAFGTGRHETTQLALEYLEEIPMADQTVIDIGCGSGILSQAARLLGCQTIIGCDIDELAVKSAVTLLPGAVFLGSADALQTASADLLLVNISAKVIDSLAAELKRILKPSGTLLATGFISARKPIHIRPDELREMNDWCCALGTRDAIMAPDSKPGAILSHDPQWW